jgi:hypothetical protein
MILNNLGILYNDNNAQEALEIYRTLASGLALAKVL